MSRTRRRLADARESGDSKLAKELEEHLDLLQKNGLSSVQGPDKSWVTVELDEVPEVSVWGNGWVGVWV